MVRARSFGVWTQRIAISVVVALVVGFAVRVGSSSSQSLVFRDPLVWLVSVATGEVVQADSGSGEVIARVSAGNPGDSLSVLQHGPDALLLNRTTGEVARVDGSTLQLAERSPVTVDPDTRLVGHGDVARLVTATNVVTVDPATAAVGAVADVAGLTNPVVGDDGVLWGLDPNRRLTAVHDATVTEVRMPDTTRPFGLVAVDGTGYLLDGSGPTLRALDGSQLALGHDACVGGNVSTDTQLGAAAEGSSVIVLADPRTATVRMSDVATGTCTSAVVDGVQDVRFGRGVESDGIAYVPLVSTGEVVIIDVDDGTVRHRVSVTTPGRDIELIVKDGVVWFNDPLGAAAGVLDEGGVRREIDKFAQVEVSASPEDGGQATVVPGPGTGGNGDGSNPDVTTGNGGTGSGNAQSVGNTGTTDGPTPDSDPSGLVADFTYSKRQVEVGEAVTFVDRSLGNPTAWTWDFGDGSFSTGPEATHAWDAVGAYKVMLRIESPNGSAAATATIEVIDDNTRTRPVADFRFSASRVEVGQSVTFTDTSTGNPQELEWDFGDGTTASGSEVEHSWSRAGTYLVTLTATNPLGSDTSVPAEITVYDRVEKPTAVISASATNAAVNQTITFTSRSTGNPTILKWDFGGGVEKVGGTVTHSWSQPGRHLVRLYVENSAGSDEAVVEVVVEPRVVRPEARIRVSATTVEVGTPVRFTSLSINEPTTLTWHWGDGNPPETVPASTLTVTHTFRTAGTYNVRLVAANDVGEDEETVTITVLSDVPAPIAAFEFAPSTVRAGEPVQFTDRSTGGPVASWRWSWGDGTRDSTSNPATHVFRSEGTYTVRLEVENSGGRHATERTVRVLSPLPRAAFTYGPSTVRVGQQVQFTDRSDNAVSWRWDFGDGDTSVERNPRHAFRERRAYVVRLTVTNSNNETSWTEQTIRVEPRPPAGTIGISPSTGITTSTDVVFRFVQAPNSDPPDTYEWEFSDGRRFTGATVARRFDRGGRFDVTLRVRNSGNDPVTITNSVTVAAVPAIRVEATDWLTGRPLRFEGTAPGADSSYQWSWEFSDGTTSSAQNPNKTFTVTGTTARQFTATLRVTAGGVTSAPVTQTVTIHPNPTADVTAPTGRIIARELSPQFGSTVTGGTATWSWRRGSATGTGENGRFEFPEPGTYDVILTVTNPGGGRAEDSVTVEVDPARPVAIIEATRTGNGTFRFRNVSIGTPFEVVEWTFGDGSDPVRGDEVTHTFDDNGPYQVTLYVRNVTGEDTSDPFVVPAAPTASFTYSPLLVITSSTEVTFTNTSTGSGITLVEWIVNDDVVPDENGNSYRRTFPVGTHTVRVRVTNRWGTVTSAPATLLVVLP